MNGPATTTAPAECRPPPSPVEHLRMALWIGRQRAVSINSLRWQTANDGSDLLYQRGKARIRLYVLSVAMRNAACVFSSMRSVMRQEESRAAPSVGFNRPASISESCLAVASRKVSTRESIGRMRDGYWPIGEIDVIPAHDAYNDIA